MDIISDLEISLLYEALLVKCSEHTEGKHHQSDGLGQAVLNTEAERGLRQHDLQDIHQPVTATPDPSPE